MKVWLNGTLCESAEARIDPSDRGFTLGDGLFETIAVKGGKVRRLEKHLQRLARGCEVLRLPPAPGSLADAIAAVLNACGLQDAAIRITYTRGSGVRGLPIPETCTPTLLVTAGPMPPPRPPVHCIVATVTRRNEHSPLSRIKSTCYLDNILAREEARQRNAGDALLLNSAGNLAEATAANLFIVKDGEVLTPPLEDGALEGIMRAQIVAQTSASERTLCVRDMMEADEVFLSNSLGLQAVAALDGTEIGTGSPGPKCLALLPLAG
ncbi:MAG: aminotransferase class IV [Rhodomicrobium sp.]